LSLLKIDYVINIKYAYTNGLFNYNVRKNIDIFKTIIKNSKK